MHGLIVGATGAGKTCWAKLFARTWLLRGGRVLLLQDNDIPDNDFPCSVRFYNPASFYSHSLQDKNRGALLIVEEAGATMGRDNGDMLKTATQARHRGQSSLFLTQFPVQVLPGLRKQCEFLVCFGIDQATCKNLSIEFMLPAMGGAHLLKRYEYLQGARFGSVKKGNISEDMKRAGLWRENG